MSVTVIASTSQVLWRVIESYGLDPAPVFKDAGLDPRRWSEKDARFDDEHLDAAWLHAVEATGDPCLGLRAARFINPASLHALGFAWLVSDTLYEALARLVRYFRMISDGMELELSTSSDSCSLAIDRLQWQPRSLAYRLDSFWAGLVAMCRLSLDDDFAPLKLEMRRPEPPCVADFYGFFRAPIIFDARRDAIMLPRGLVEQPLPTGNRDLARANERVVADYLARFDASNLPDRVRARLVEALPGGQVDEEQLAQAFNVSRRTLQRRLAEAGTSFTGLLDEARRELALRYIGERRMSIKEVTYMLGFSEPGNFSRAFKRWTGQAPSRFRAAVGE
jgi:AraC-like DNA-binding protein